MRMPPAYRIRAMPRMEPPYDVPRLPMDCEGGGGRVANSCNAPARWFPQSRKHVIHSRSLEAVHLSAIVATSRAVTIVTLLLRRSRLRPGRRENGDLHEPGAAAE